LHAARVELSSLEAQTERLRREQGQLSEQIAATRHTRDVSERRLEENLSLLYKQGDVDELAFVLGAESLDEALTRVDDLNRVADQSKQFVEITSQAEAQLAVLSATLADRRTRLERGIAEARRTASSLLAARADRLAFIGRLRTQAQLKRSQVHELEAAAQRVVKKSATLQAAAAPGPTTTAPSPVDAAPPTESPAPLETSGRTITVSSTGYSLSGQTATGMPVGWGVVAVDPAVIPLGTRLTIPGYGEAVAADTGGAVRGSTIDLWFPTLAQARAWGRRTVTITLH
jgi:3D (Asp-Asp-Asp) domain-containing protein